MALTPFVQLLLSHSQFLCVCTNYLF